MSEASIGTQWKKGQSGNPKGRPKKPFRLPDQGETFTHIFRTLLDQPCEQLGSDELITRLTRIARDVAARADLGDMAAVKLIAQYTDCGDRRRVQALRAARRARSPEGRAFEERIAREIAALPPPLPDGGAQFALPAREARIEHEKPAKRAPSPAHVDRMGREINPYAHEPDPLAGIPKHRVSSPFERYKPYPDVLPGIAAREKSASETGAITGPKTGPVTGVKTGVKTGLITGVITGPISGLKHATPPRQTVDAALKSKLRGSAYDFLQSNSPPPPNRDDLSRVNGQ